MSITEIINKFYIKSVNDIQNCHNQEKKRNLVKELIGNLIQAGVTFSERELSKEIGISRQLVHKMILEINNKNKIFFLIILINFLKLFVNIEIRGRKKFEINHPEIISDIEEICQNTKNIDKSIKGEIYYTDVTLRYVKEKLQSEKYNYIGKECPSIGTISRIMRECLGYKLIKIKKCLVYKRIEKTDAIFKNVFAKKEEMKNNDNIVAISIDDKVAKYIGKLSALGYSWLVKLAYDHDTNPDCIAKPFGIMDIKEKLVHVFCTLSNSTANFKVDCIEEFITQKLKNTPNIEKLMIMLDNGPENSSRRKLWMFRVIELAIKFNIKIELVYYPPYHSKYNLIEHFWGVLQKHWSGMIIDNVDKLIGAINSTTWAGVNAIGYLKDKAIYEKGEKVDEDKLNDLIQKHVSYPDDNIKQWSLIIHP